MLSPATLSSFQILAGFTLGGLVGYAAWRVRALNASGAWAAGLLGSLIFGLGGWRWALILLAFFLSSSLLSRLAGEKKAGLSEKFAKGNQRDWGQVLANGGVGALLVIAHTIFPQQPWLWLAYAGAFATVNADTWATELGVFNPRPPRLVTNWRPVERGASGGVSAVGYLAATGGAALIAGLGVAMAPTLHFWTGFGVLAFSGVAGASIDSILGASIQAIYHCPRCQKETEHHPLHTCGTQTVQIRGMGWLNNDWVNALSSLAGALIAAGLWLGVV